MRTIFNDRAGRGCFAVGALTLGVLALGSIGGCATGQRSAGPSAEKSDTQHGKSERRPAAPVADNAELAALYAADQADRTPGTAPSDWHVVESNDAARQARVRQMLDADLIKTGQDYFHAGMVYQHATNAEGVQLAHELAMIGACLGSTDARWLAAASYDRFLMDLKRPQRFGTQYRSSEAGAMKLYETSEGVTDAMRAALNTPSLQKAKDREKEMQAMLEELAKTMKAEGTPK